MSKKPLFKLGQILATPGAIGALEATGENAFHFVTRHVSGDWGDVDEHDAQENIFSVENGYRILSAYHLRDQTKIWVITEADRSATTILLPAEY